MVPPASHRVSRVLRYSGSCSLLPSFAYMTFTSYGVPSHALRLNFSNARTQPYDCSSATPNVFLHSVWPPPRSLATTSGISVDFFSSPYLDVSVQAVPPIQLWIHCMVTGHDSSRIAPFGHLRIKACLRLPEAFRC